MSDVTVTFYGVCTHVNAVNKTRTIAVNGRFGARLGGHAVPPHMQYLYIPAELLAEDPGDVPGLTRVPPDPDFGDVFWSMDGVNLTLANTQGLLHRTPDFHKIPRLKDVAGKSDLQIDDRMFAGRASCAFDIYAGELDAYRDPAAGNAIVGQLKATTTDDDGSELVVTRVWDNALTSIYLLPDAFVFILNIGEEIDTAADFLLHYLATTWTPTQGVVPTPPPVPDLREPNENDGLRFLGRLPQGLTLGCSNSNYP